MEFYNPITDEVVEFAKSVSPMYGAKNAFADQPTRTVRALLPTGSHVGRGQNLDHFTGLGGKYRQLPRNRGNKGATGLAHYGRVGKAFGGKMPTTRVNAAWKGKRVQDVKRANDWQDLKWMEAHGKSLTDAHAAANKKAFGKRDVSDLAYQPGMINPGIVTSSWSHGSPNQNFGAGTSKRGRRIS